MSKYSDQIRKDWRKSDLERDKGLTTPKDIVRFDDISYGSHPEWNLLDVYKPKKAGKSPLPVIMIVHGGAWVYGDKEIYQHYAMSLAQRGFAVVNFSYRLAPEYKFPASTEDTCAVFKWIGDNADKYGFDTDHVFAVGDSAGAHLLGLFSALYSNPAYRSEMKKAYPKAKLTIARGVKLKAIALNCGKYDLKAYNAEDKDLKKAVKDFLTENGSKKELELTDVCAHVTDKYPPAFIMTVPGDFLRSQARLIANALTDNSVPFIFRYYGSKKNPLHHVFHCNMRLEDARICNDDECGFFKLYV